MANRPTPCSPNGYSTRVITLTRINLDDDRWICPFSCNTLDAAVQTRVVRTDTATIGVHAKAGATWAITVLVLDHGDMSESSGDGSEEGQRDGVDNEEVHDEIVTDCRPRFNGGVVIEV
jgi:hypothetical protein